MNFSWILLAVVFLAFAHAVVAAPGEPIPQTSSESPITRTKRCDAYGNNCVLPALTGNQANGGGGNNGGLGGNGGNVGNSVLQPAVVVVATPVASPLTRTKRCDIYGRNCGFPGLIGNQANGGGGDNNGTGGNGGNVGNDGLQIDTTNSKDRKARATPVASPLTRTKRCDDAGTPCGLPALFGNQANGGGGNNGGKGGNGGNLGNTLVTEATRMARATPVDSPLTRTKRCDNAGSPCHILPNQADRWAGGHQGIAGRAGIIENRMVPIRQ